MAWHQIGDKPLSEPMLTWFTGAYMRIRVRRVDALKSGFNFQTHLNDRCLQCLPHWGPVQGLTLSIWFTCPSGTWFWKFTCPAKIFMCPAKICTSPVKFMYTAGKISTCPDWKFTCPVGHVTTKVYVPWDKIYMPWACRHALMSSPAVLHICNGNLAIIDSDSDNGLSHGQRQAIIWTNAGIL